MSLFLEKYQIASLGQPIDLQGTGNTMTIGDWIDLSNALRVIIVLFKSIGTAGDDPTLTVLQATDNAGTGSKALNFTQIFRKESTDAAGLKAVASWTRTTQSAANTYTHATSAESEVLWVVEFDADQLDADGGFNHINATVADVGSNAQLGCGFVLVEMRDQTAPASMRTVLS